MKDYKNPYIEEILKLIENNKKIPQELNQKFNEFEVQHRDLHVTTHEPYPKPTKIQRFVNYRNLGLFISQLAHDYDRLGLDKFLEKEYKCHGMYARYLAGYRDYLIHKETGKNINRQVYKGKFILDPYLHEDYFKYKNKSALDNALNILIPELYNYGFIFTSVQESVQSFVKGTEYEKGF